jgi:hypothetical protein
VKVELKCFSVVEEIDPPNGALNLPFYRPRKGPGLHEREREREKNRGKRKIEEEIAPGLCHPPPIGMSC